MNNSCPGIRLGWMRAVWSILVHIRPFIPRQHMAQTHAPVGVRMSILLRILFKTWDVIGSRGTWPGLRAAFLTPRNSRRKVSYLGMGLGSILSPR